MTAGVDMTNLPPGFFYKGSSTRIMKELFPMTIDISKIKAGDTVYINRLVKSVENGHVYFDINQDWSRAGVADIISHTPAQPKPLKVGETVVWSLVSGHCKIIAIDDQAAWIRSGHNQSHIASLSALERVDES